MTGFDPSRNATFLTRPGVIKELENPLKVPFLTWGGLRRIPSSTLTAYTCAVIASRLGIAEAAEVTRLVLTAMDLHKFRCYTVPAPEHLPPGEEWRTNVLDTSALAYWQWAYWLARHRGLL
jgi:hypothetical protein